MYMYTEILQMHLWLPRNKPSRAVILWEKNSRSLLILISFFFSFFFECDLRIVKFLLLDLLKTLYVFNVNYIF